MHFVFSLRFLRFDAYICVRKYMCASRKPNRVYKYSELSCKFQGVFPYMDSGDRVRNAYGYIMKG